VCAKDERRAKITLLATPTKAMKLQGATRRSRRRTNLRTCVLVIVILELSSRVDAGSFQSPSVLKKSIFGLVWVSLEPGHPDAQTKILKILAGAPAAGLNR